MRKRRCGFRTSPPLRKKQETSATVYEINQATMATWEPMTDDAIDNSLNLIIEFIKNSENKYFMMLCHECRNYTLFNFVNNNYDDFPQEMKECLFNRGIILDIDFADEKKQAFEIWIKDINGEAHCYFFFPYDLGVIEL